MATDSTKPTWIEPPPKQGGMGCVGKGCLFGGLAAVLILLLVVLGSYLFVSHALVSSKPAPLPVKPLPKQELTQLQDRLDEFKATPPAATPTPASSIAPGATPSPTPGPEHQLSLSATQINGLIAANKHSRGHAFVTISGNTAHVELSIPTDKIPGIPRGYLNGSFIIETNGPTPISGLQVSKIEANGYPVPSSVLSTTYRGQSVMGMALETAASYNVSTVEIRNGVVLLY
jgi:hypothetical protein